jgi:mono/diheme cytochrome c family protein
LAKAAGALWLGLGLPALAADAAKLELGRRVYEEQRCQLCHSVAGAGNTRGPLDGVGSRLSAEEIRKWIVEPQTMKPGVRKRAYDKLPADRLDALVAYVASLK